eukprot:CAMPEP_0185571746 /NCGR_PEP_ID=MMETSP0434-20130131/3758_1 /TAXON_ID=626734 ORGANISM="Favella taraikaensis, Strain Fe Narragansett Bay" /NCGR_SAMPLE_ID=MMETSP0434 /ASSEMBLY_ACC=CAM_ASM_000379 /LENGTH=41 /DNA_ID= /DNA_START= /DNA_END= /DNA_ORIENTATION=
MEDTSTIDRMQAKRAQQEKAKQGQQAAAAAAGEGAQKDSKK